MKTCHLIWGLVFLGAVLPIVGYYAIVECVPSDMPEVVKKELAANPEATVLLDVRSKQQWSRRHLDFARHLPVEVVLDIKSCGEIPSDLQGKTVFVLCESGMDSIWATKHLRQLGVEAISVRGGVQEWIADAIRDQEDDPYRGWIASEATDLETLGVKRTYGRAMQGLAFLAAFIVKPAYMLLSLALIIFLWLKRPLEKDGYALMWGLIAFFVGESACALNYIFFHEKSYLWEYFHMYGMLVATGLMLYAFLEAIDLRVLRTTGDRPCALLGVCRQCIKTSQVPCPMRQLFLVGLPALMVVALMPACSDWHTTSYNTVILGTPYNYTHLAYQQLFECLVCPAVAIIAMVISLVITLKYPRPTDAAKVALCVGLGPLAFGTFRTVLAGMYDQNRIWFNFWEEVTELIAILSIVAVLWVFRQARTGLSKEDQSRSY